MPTNDHSKFVIIGGGLGGALLACYLGKAGFRTEVYEMRDDLRTTELPGGRSINLALSYRGLCALEPVGLVDEVLRQAIPMRGRMIHAVTGETVFQPYGVDDSQAINSVSRAGLNIALLNAAAKYPNVRLFFDQKCTDVRLDNGDVELLKTKTHERSTVHADVVLSADGAFSVVRRIMQKQDRFNYSQEYLGHGYKELTIPSGPGGAFALEKNALHIWPRKSFMMIALPNADGSFTCTLFWPFEGANSFAAVPDEGELLRFFEEQFPDALPLMPTIAHDYFMNPTSSMVTVRCTPWHAGGRVVLLGDAAHAVVPFYGQGMNAAFEDVLVLDECVKKHRPDWARVFEAYETARRPHTDALADLAVHNFLEMRDKTGSRMFLMQKKAEKFLSKLLPGLFVPLYIMVTFTRIPYAEAVHRAYRQKIAVWMGLIGLATITMIALSFWIR